MKQSRELFVNSVRTIPIDGQAITPTVVRYKDKVFEIGHPSSGFEDDQCFVVDDFKISLGRGDYASISKTSQELGPSHKRSKIGIAQDFMYKALDRVSGWAEGQGIAFPQHILVAEPLSLEDANIAGDSWLANYRSNIRRILHKFSEVDFLPEPFAVFQYYRYGIRHPLIAQKKKHVALVLDFGGGTFDVSVIETTAMGDISQSGRNQRPLAAKSVAAAGFHINRKIAEYVLFKAVPDLKKNTAARRALDLYLQGKNVDNDPTINPEIHVFLRHFQKIVREAERAKIAICSSISRWNLDANLSSKVPYRIRVPIKIFSPTSDFAEIPFDAGELKSLFETEIWARKLRAPIQEVLKRASSDLNGMPISIVLLSGGSSNIGWLRSLIERDLCTELAKAEILGLAENFQEIVSKGLAIECARRYYTEGEGDFQGVLYNKLCLLLSPNDQQLELRKFKPVSPEDLPESNDDAVLFPSASNLKARIGENLKWKVRLSRTPTQNMSYFFMRSSFDPDDTAGRLNVIETSLRTPREALFGQSVEVGLVVREDGTATPSFTYGRGKTGREVEVRGNPFFLDMTSAYGQQNVNSYIGFDFGSSTSSFSLISREDVNVYRDRQKQPSWGELSDLIGNLPYPVASHLGRYLSETNPESLFKRGRAALEASLCFLCYLVYAEYRAQQPAKSALFKNLRNRSAGPLWAFLKETLPKLRGKAAIADVACRMLANPYFELIDEAVNEVAKEKHDKVASVDFNRVLNPIANLIHELTEDSVFGYFEEVWRKPFTKGYEGVFRSLKGPNSPFVELYNYRGEHSFSSNQVFMVNMAAKTATELTPLYVWGLNTLRGVDHTADLYMYDTVNKESFGFNAVQDRGEIQLKEDSELSELWKLVAAIRERDEQQLAHPEVELERK